jgi:nitroreductase
MALVRDPDLVEPQLAPVLQGRWSPRAFDASHELTTDDLHLMLEAARWAPSAGNTQPWSFIVGRRGDATFDAFFEHLSRGNKAWAGNASALLVALHQNAAGPDHDLPWNTYAAYDLGQAAAHLSVQAHSIGLHAHQFAGFDHDATAATFAVPEHWTVKTGIAIGLLGDPDVLDESTREKELRPRTRREITDFAFSGAWGEQPVDLG